MVPRGTVLDPVEQGLRKSREFGIEFELHAGGEKRHSLEQALDVGVGYLEPVHPQSCGNLGKLLRELRAHFAQML
jgi:hypothetical protein